MTKQYRNEVCLQNFADSSASMGWRKALQNDRIAVNKLQKGCLQYPLLGSVHVHLPPLFLYCARRSSKSATFCFTSHVAICFCIKHTTRTIILYYKRVSSVWKVLGSKHPCACFSPPYSAPQKRMDTWLEAWGEVRRGRELSILLQSTMALDDISFTRCYQWLAWSVGLYPYFSV